jgi:hypothetical protein
MSNKKISEMPLVKSEDVKPLSTGDDIIEKLAICVNGMREMKSEHTQRFDLELMYSLAIYLRDKR